MDINELTREAISTLTLNKMRTGLAILGIVIGVGSVIALISLGQGTQKAIESQIQSLGSNLLTVIPGSSGGAFVRGGAGSATTLTLEDAEAVKTNFVPDLVNRVSPELSNRAQVTAGRNNTNTSVTGVYPEYAEVRKVQVASGSFITERDVSAMSKVAVIGPTAVTALFGEGVDPVGQSIRIETQSLLIVGVTVAKGGAGFNNPDDAIYVPLSTAQKQIFGRNYLSNISVEVVSQNKMTQAQDDIGYLLLARHHLNDPASADFSIISQNDILNTANAATGTFTALLGGIAAISLLVGGIGIMNIMLVTVTERTREIGLRKALGAKRAVITAQFLFESVLLTLTGGFFGAVFGVGSSYLLSQSLHVPFAFSVFSIVLAVGVSGGIGILFGWYPARKAAALQPIEALRYE